jgi:four helix bundle protein
MESTDTKSDPLREKSFLFAVRIVNLSRYLVETKKEYALSKQIIRSGTNPGAMVREAANAESGADFIHKLAIAQKEAGETQFWLDLLYKTEFLAENEYKSLFSDCDEIMRLLTSSIRTKKKNMEKKTAVIISIIAVCAFFLFKI